MTNPPVYTTGSWRPYPGHEDAFLDEWLEFASWSARMPGAQLAFLARDLRDAERFVSFVGWDSLDDIHAWKTSPEFKPRMARVQAQYRQVRSHRGRGRRDGQLEPTTLTRDTTMPHHAVICGSACPACT